MPDVSRAQIEALLRQLGLVDPGYTGPVEVTAKTESGSESVTITV